MKSFYNKYLAWHYKGKINGSGFFLLSIGVFFWYGTIISFLIDKKNSLFILLIIFLITLFTLYAFGGLIVKRVRDIGWPTYFSVIIFIGLIFGLLNHYILGITALILILYPSKESAGSL